MERSQSCSSFETSTSNVTSSLIRNVLEYSALQQSNSQQNLSNSVSDPNSPDFPDSNTALRRKTFQRQRSATFSDDTDYGGDLEEEDDDEDDDEVLAIANSSKLPTNQSRHRLNYQPTLPSQPEIGFNSSISLPNHHETHFSSSTTCLTQHHHQHFSTSTLLRDNSIHSDSSRYSSVDSLLESRKPDPEAILINLGFGPVGTDDILSRIPRRFLKPSQVKGNDTEAFVKRLQLANNLADHSVLGYRGLTGNPDIQPSFIVAKIMQRFEVNERKKSMGSIEQTM